eukprot:3035757-Prymnesium_polylepis.3
MPRAFARAWRIAEGKPARAAALRSCPCGGRAPRGGAHTRPTAAEAQRRPRRAARVQAVYTESEAFAPAEGAHIVQVFGPRMSRSTCRCAGADHR